MERKRRENNLLKTKFLLGERKGVFALYGYIKSEGGGGDEIEITSALYIFNVINFMTWGRFMHNVDNAAYTNQEVRMKLLFESI